MQACCTLPQTRSYMILGTSPATSTLTGRHGKPHAAPARASYLIYLGNCLIAFGSKLQLVVALSSSEAEYMALSLITRILLWVVHMIENIPVQFVRHPIIVYEDA